MNSLLRILDAPGPVEDLSETRLLLGLSFQELSDLAARFGQPAYRGRQLAEALYRSWVADTDEMTTLPLEFRKKLKEQGFHAGLPRIVQTFQSHDGTERYLIQLSDGQTVETVWMPEGDGGESGDGSEAGRDESRRATLCVSSQIGCAVSCQFCLTATLGLSRSLTAGEIVGQVLAVLKQQAVALGRDRVNLVFMGMGEPFLNYANFMAAVRLLVEEVGISETRMTVSTSGIVPGIEQFAAEPIRPKLAISLNAPNNQVREQIMPVTRKWPIEAILAAVRTIPLRPREKVTLEYVLLGGVTDRPEHADEVIRLVRRANLPLKVNLIVWNPGPGVAYRMPEADAVEEFHQRLMRAGVPAFLRRPRGRDIYAACGQLKKTAEE